MLQLYSLNLYVFVYNESHYVHWQSLSCMYGIATRVPEFVATEVGYILIQLLALIFHTSCFQGKKMGRRSGTHHILKEWKE